MNHRHAALPALLLILLPLGGCSSAYYAAWEKLGYAKRDLLVDQVQDAREQQADTKETFADALDQFKSSFDFDGGDIEQAYDKLSGEYDGMEREAERLRAEIDKVEDIADDLFDEWEDDIDDQTNADYRRMMKDQRASTMKAYKAMIGKMHEAESKIDPVLNAFQERTLLLKSALNAKAIASLETTSQELIGDIETLIREMNESIAEADEFIAAMSE